MGVYAGMDDIDPLITISRKVHPDSDRWERYDQLYHEYRQLYELLVPFHRRLYDIQ